MKALLRVCVCARVCVCVYHMHQQPFLGNDLLCSDSKPSSLSSFCFFSTLQKPQFFLNAVRIFFSDPTMPMPEESKCGHFSSYAFLFFLTSIASATEYLNQFWGFVFISVKCQTSQVTHHRALFTTPTLKLHNPQDTHYTSHDNRQITNLLFFLL